MSEPALLSLERVSVVLPTSRGLLHAVNGVDLDRAAGRTLGIVGESGCGKTMLSRAIMQLLPAHARLSGRVRFAGQELTALDAEGLRRLRVRAIAVVFQNPMTSLNPVLTIGRQIAETLTLHQGLGRKAALARAVAMLRLVHIPEPERRVAQYPHQLSGGMRQRVMIAMALACNPKLLIADEPTTALDVTIQAQILDLLRELKEQIDAAIVLITHDLGVVAEMAQRVIVMYAGKKAEEAPVKSLFRRPLHPYTKGLLGSMPRLGAPEAGLPPRLTEIAGTVPSLKEPIPGCAFAERCFLATDICRHTAPSFEEKEPGHFAACFHSDRVAGA